MTPRSSATKAPSARRISPIDATSSSSRSAGSAQLTSQVSTAASSKRPAARSSSVMAAERSAPETPPPADREAELGSPFRRLETGAGRESRAGEDKVAVVIGEAERRAVAAQELP